MTEKIPENMDILAILRMLPHRYPFVMVDRITQIVPGEKISGIKNVTINEPFFQGHFPEHPVMPGVMILEGMAQVGGVLGYHTLPEMMGNKLLYFAGIDNARFRKPVMPGDQLVFDLNLLKIKRGIMVMEGTAHVDGRLVAEAELMASFG
ncbi:3-hydroxyacyl-ACP dehydratase FabZ [Desulfopila inferna]|uniref:3-hydroxyacyl-ACP dehydratase FabZ n=1 Tax=Desulfopila inferna TaxID=468528 RepID=UPI001965DB67|nr:3-hydroxyacyl-ACP dehydratase FabZ [Desulfopila inferna]MBM9603220.1 3-hydroxyacyl-ACP dehydratase FabZ [Desulfopila inferna]